MASQKDESNHFIVCRFCLTDSSNATKGFISDENKMYEKMVRDTFNIQICHLHSFDEMICIECSENFKLAAKVKNRLLSRLAIGEYLNENGCAEENYVKPEPEISQTSQEKSRTFSKGVSKRITKQHLTLTPGDRRIKNTAKSKNTEKDKTCEKTALDGARSNTLKLITNSNMCLFRLKRTKLACYSCAETFFDISELRAHSLTHTSDNLNSKKITYKNVDISNLSCKICSKRCQDLNGLREHLLEHRVTFENAEHLLVPYRLEEGFTCVFCQETFATLMRLAIHMNSHSTSNICETCGMAFTNRNSLTSHINRVHTEKKCSKCPSVFHSTSARLTHMRSVHGKLFDRKQYCAKCEMTFRYSYQVTEHMIEDHGAKRQKINCEFCSKPFSSPTAIRIHVRAVHIAERNYKCLFCDRSFFRVHDKRRHERSHGDGKFFACGFCEVQFRSKDAMKKHLRRKHNVQLPPKRSRSTNVVETCDT